MKRYKIVNSDNNIIAVKDETEMFYVSYNTESGLVTFCKNKEFAFGAKINGQIYSFGKQIKNYPIINLVPIDIIEFNQLKAILETPSLQVVVDNEADNIFSQNIFDDAGLNSVRNKKLENLKITCNQMITSGFTIILSDKKEHHFDLTIEDQLNLQSMRFALLRGDEQIAYHSKGNAFEYFSAEDARLIVTSADDHILYHNSYYNSIRTYFEAIADVILINNFKYGDSIPDVYKSEVLKDFIIN